MFQGAAAQTPAELERWLIDRGEPCEVDGTRVSLRALPVKILLEATLSAKATVNTRTPVSRLVGLLFDLSVHLHADVALDGTGLSRAGLWLRLADEQDRQRIAAALARAEERGCREEVLQRLWTVIAELRPGHDDRWDVSRERIVELLEVGEDVPAEVVPVAEPLHLAAWRWLGDAWPGLAEVDLGSVWPR